MGVGGLILCRLFTEALGIELAAYGADSCMSRMSQLQLCV